MELIFSQYSIYSFLFAMIFLMSFQSLPKKSVKSGAAIIGLMCIVACLFFVFFCAANTSHGNVFKYIFRNKETKKSVLRPKFPEYVISCDYGLT